MSQTKTHYNKADQDIIDRLLSNGIDKRRGEDQLFNNYAYFIREGMHKYSLTEDEAFDAYSDTILSAIQKITDGSFEGRSSLKTYLFQIFQNKCVDLLRKKATNKNKVHQTIEITDLFSHLSDSAKSVIQRLIEKADWDALKEKLNNLGDSCRKLLLLSADGFSDKDIAISLEYKTADVVKTSRLRCLEKLRQMYKANR